VSVERRLLSARQVTRRCGTPECEAMHRVRRLQVTLPNIVEILIALIVIYVAVRLFRKRGRVTEAVAEVKYAKATA